MKNLDYYKKEIRKKFPTYSKEEVEAAAQSAYESDPESTYKKANESTNKVVKPTFNVEEEDEESDIGISLGFGTTATKIPLRMAPYVVSLIKTNPKAYANIKNAVKAATGKTYNDPTQLGAWIQRLTENIFLSGDPIVKSMSVEDFIRGSAKFRTATGKPKADLSRSVYEYSPEQIGADVDKIAQDVLGRNINDADKAASWYSELTNAVSNMAAKGTVSTVKDIRNPKTGKLERVTTQVPKFSKEVAALKIKSTLRDISPEDAARKERSDFMSWMLGQKGAVE